MSQRGNYKRRIYCYLFSVMFRHLKQKEIMIIDDNVSELRLFEEAFKETHLNFVLKKFTDAKDALNYFVIHAKEIFMIISDISMPGMTGPELLDTINQNHELKMEAVPFIFFSNSNNQKDILNAYSLAAQGYFQKPMELNESVDLFKSLIDYWSRARIPNG